MPGVIRNKESPMSLQWIKGEEEWWAVRSSVRIRIWLIEGFFKKVNSSLLSIIII